MTTLQIIAAILVFTALGGYVNHRYLRLPSTIGNMAFALVISLIATALGELGWLDLDAAADFVNQIDFSAVVLQGMLSFMLFAGALHINFGELRSVKWQVGVLATVGVGLATLITGTLIWWAATAVGLQIDYIHALLFGALISPTDPIAVLAILKDAKISRRLYVKIGGESLFNDGTGVVLFLTLLGVASGNADFSLAHIPILLAREVFGGIALGWALGWIMFRLLKPVDDYKLEALLTLALAAGGYVLAEALHVSAPICTVASGLVIGNQGRHLAMTEYSRKRLDMFWELLDEIFNAVLFMLIGLEIIVITVRLHHLVIGVLAIFAVLAGRFLSVALPLGIMRPRKRFDFRTYGLFTWGGLRGGISIAMALALPPGPAKDLFLPVTYLVVLFSILVQGLTFKHALPLFLKNK